MCLKHERQRERQRERERSKTLCAFTMSSNLSDHQLSIDTYMYKILYINLVETRNQKPVIDMQKIKRKESKYITKGSQLIVREERKGIKK